MKPAPFDYFAPTTVEETCTLERSSVVREQFPLLSAAVAWIGHPQIRNRGTVGGSLAHADPTAELPALALALDATLTIVASNGRKRALKPEEFFVSFLTTALDTGEMLCEASFPSLTAGTGWSFAAHEFLEERTS